MQTPENAIRYMVSQRGSTTTNLERSLRIFDCMSDVKEYLLTKMNRTGPVTYGPNIGKYHNWISGWKVYELSPVKAPKKILVSAKWLGVPEYVDGP